MSDDTDPRAIWQNQPKEDPVLMLEKLQRNMTRFHQAARWDNWLNYYIALPIAVVVLSYAFYRNDSLLARIACGLMLAAAVIGTYDIFTHGKPKEAPFGLSVSEAVVFLKSELVRRRNLLRRAFWWAVALIWPAVTLWFANNFAEISARGTPTTSFIVRLTVAVLVAATWTWWYTLWRANRLQKQIDALPHVDEI